MSEPLLRTEPPTEPQIELLRRISEERGLEMPPPHSKTEATLLINEILRREYQPSTDRHDTTPADEDAEWLARIRDDFYEYDG